MSCTSRSRALPLDNLDDNFKAADALIDELGNPAEWPRADVDHRQPAVPRSEAPQAGARPRLRQRRAPRLPRGSGHGRLLRLLVSQGARPSSDLHAEDPVAGRAGLVGTQNIRNNQSRVGGLDYVVKSGTIIEAVENQPWSGEANVHVSIANWVKTQDKLLLPKQKRNCGPKSNRSAPRSVQTPGTGSAVKQFDLVLPRMHVNKFVAFRRDRRSSQRRARLQLAPTCYTGQYPRHRGFVLAGAGSSQMIAADRANAWLSCPSLSATSFFRRVTRRGG